MERQIVEISWGSLWRVFLAVMLAVTAYLIRDVLVTLVLAIVIASALDPLISFLQKWRIHRLLGTLVIYLSVFFGIAIILYKAVPIAMIELTNFLNNLSISSSTLFGEEYLIEVSKTISERISGFNDILLSGSSSLLGVASSFFGSVTLVVSVLILSFYLTVSHDGVERFLFAILPQQYESYALQIFERTKKKIGVWLRSQIMLSCIIGLSVGIGMAILGVPYAFLLGILAAVFELIPFVGPIFAGGIAVLVAFSQSFDLALYTLIMFLVVQQLESNVLIPLVMRHQIGLHPALVLVSLLAGVALGGVVGIILAVPAMVFLRELVEDWSDQKRKRAQMGV